MCTQGSHDGGNTEPDKHICPPHCAEWREIPPRAKPPFPYRVPQQVSLAVYIPYRFRAPVGCLTVRARADPPSLRARHFTLRFLSFGLVPATCSHLQDPRSTQSPLEGPPHSFLSNAWEKNPAPIASHRYHPTISHDKLVTEAAVRSALTFVRIYTEELHQP